MRWPWWDRSDNLIDSLIRPPRVLHDDFNPGMRVRREKVREIAEKLERRAAAVHSGSGAADLLRAVK